MTETDGPLIELLTLHPHAYYPDGGPVRVVRYPGDRYRVTDAPGLTARQYAARMIALGVVRRVDPKSHKAKASPPCEPAS